MRFTGIVKQVARAAPWLKAFELCFASSRQSPQELVALHSILERFSPVDEDYRHLIVVLLSQLRIGVDIYFPPLKFCLAMHLRERLLNCVAKMTALPRIHHYVVHRPILTNFSGI